MPAIKLGATPITAIRLGAVPVTAVKLGSTPVWSPNTMIDNFIRDDEKLSDDAAWVDEYHTLPEYVASVVDGVCRMGLPEGLLVLFPVYSDMRYAAAQHPADDGYIECRVGTKGDSNTLMISQLFRRGANTGRANGVGIRLRASALSIVRRVSTTDTEMEACGAYGVGDVIRLQQVGNVHTMIRNGDVVGAWNDSGATAASGSGNRSMLLTVNGAKDFLGPRRFSAAFDYVECS